jgi:hypothetical protein
MLATLAPSDWVGVLAKLANADARALLDAAEGHDARLAHTLHAAHRLWVASALANAHMVSVLGGVTVHTAPTPEGYTLRCGPLATHTSRRMFVHDFPRFCAACCTQAPAHIDSYLAFTPDVARTLPLDDGGGVAGVRGVVAWAQTRLRTALLSYPEGTQAHASFLVGVRVGAPRRQRGRRARRWTKVPRGNCLRPVS